MYPASRALIARRLLVRQAIVSTGSGARVVASSGALPGVSPPVPRPLSAFTGNHAAAAADGRVFSHLFSTSTTTPDRRGEIPDSHDDFKPRYKNPAEATPVHESITKDITENPIMLYMKGVPDAPQCGFSAMVCRILEEYGVEFNSRNVLADQELREGVKAYSKWPTIPQLYVNGEFVGGCDIVVGMHRNGELEELLRSVRQKKAGGTSN